MYGGRMGNDAPGDALKYHGRGYLPLVGKENYERAGKALELDLVNHPELAAQPEHAGRIAVWQWQTRVPEAAREDARSHACPEWCAQRHRSPPAAFLTCGSRS